MARNRTVNLNYKEGSRDDPYIREGFRHNEDPCLADEDSSNQNDGALLAYLRSAGRHPLLMPEEERALAEEIESCREELVELCMELSPAF